MCCLNLISYTFKLYIFIELKKYTNDQYKWSYKNIKGLVMYQQIWPENNREFFFLTEVINNSADHHFIGHKVWASKEIPLNFTTIRYGIG